MSLIFSISFKCLTKICIFFLSNGSPPVRRILFEPNDQITRNQASSVVSRLLDSLVSQRGLADFLVVCDTTNNTPARIDRNELHIDVAVQPIKAVEFIYIPIRIQNTLGTTGNS